MKEMKERYYEAMRDVTLRRIIAIDYQDEDSIVILPYKYPGRTEFSEKFLRNRCIFAAQYYLSHRLIRNIVAKAHLFLPEVFCNFERYRGLGFLDLDR